MAAAKTGATMVALPPLELERMQVEIVGDSPLVMHAFSEKAKKQMLEKQMKSISAGKRPPKDPQQEYEDSILRDINGDPAVKSVALKSAMVDAASQIEGVTKVFLRGVFHVEGDFVPIIGTPRMRSDTVRVANGVSDIRFRAEFTPWGAIFVVRYDKRNIPTDWLIDLVRRAGFSCGIGEYRPQKDGQWGMFSVRSTAILPPLQHY